MSNAAPAFLEAIEIAESKPSLARRAELASRGDRIVLLLAIMGAAAAVALVVALATQSFLIGSVAGGWVYPFFQGFGARFIVSGLIGAIGLMLGVRLATGLVERRQALAIAVVVAAGFIVQLILRASALAPLWAAVRSGRANGFYGPALQFSIARILSGQGRTALPDHVRTNMPGKFVLFKALLVASHSAAWIGLMLAFLSALAGVAVYLVARELGADRRAAVFATAVYLVLPGRVVFLPILNTITPLVVLSTFWVYLRALRSASVGMGAAFGAALFVMVFFEPLPLVSGFIFVGMLWHALSYGGKRLKDYWHAAAAAIGAFLVVYIVLRLALSYDFFAGLAYLVHDARSFNATSRPYGVWAVANMIEFAIAIGAASTVILLGSFANREWRTWSSGITLLAVTSLATIAIVDLLGLNRGEVTRLWIFLAAFVAIPIGTRLASHRSLLPLAVVVLSLAVQTSVEAGMIAFVVP